jgi:putative transposase
MNNEYTKESLLIAVACSNRCKRIVVVQDFVATERGYLRCLQSDNDPEFASTVLLDCARKQDMKNMLTDPGKHGQNGIN